METNKNIPYFLDMLLSSWFYGVQWAFKQKLFSLKKKKIASTSRFVYDQFTLKRRFFRNEEAKSFHEFYDLRMEGKKHKPSSKPSNQTDWMDSHTLWLWSWIQWLEVTVNFIMQFSSVDLKEMFGLVTV